MDDMYQYAASAVNNSNPDAPNGISEEDDPIIKAFSSFGWGARFNGLVNSVKKQSEAIVQVTRNDIQEFASVLREDVSSLSAAPENTGEEPGTQRSFAPLSALRERLGGINTVNFSALHSGLSDTLSQSLPSQLTSTSLPDNINVGQLQQELDQGTRFAEQYLQKFGAEIIQVLSKAITVLEPESDGEEAAAQDQSANEKKKTTPRIFASRKDALLADLQTNEDTFLKDPCESLSDDDQGKKVLETFDVDQHTAKIAQLLEDFTDLHAMMSSLVPVKVSYVTFWQRYFYHTWKLDQDEKTRELLTKSHEEEEVKWDSDEDDEPASSELAPAKEEAEASNKPGESDGDYSNISEPGSTEASIVSPPLKSQTDGEDWVQAEKRKENGDNEDSDSDWE